MKVGSKYYGMSRLLEKVAYCERRPSEATDLLGNKVTVIDTFPYNPESKTAPETARRWADERWHATGYFEPKIEVLDNEPFKVTITDLDVRCEGGRAYKVVDGKSRRFDLREDQVLEVMRLRGILPGGQIPGTFVWGILGSQVRLTLVGGELHSQMVEESRKLAEAAAKRAAGESITPGKLQTGHVYRKTVYGNDNFYVFVGRVTVLGAKKPLYAFVELENTEEWKPVDQSWKDTEIILFSTPKGFDEKVGETDVSAFRTNKHCNFAYVNGTGDDIVEIEFEKRTGHPRWHRPSGLYRWGASREEMDRCVKEWDDLSRKQKLDDRKAFRDSLSWA